MFIQIIFLSLNYLLHAPARPVNNTYFEGRITYHINYFPKDNFDIKDWKEWYGDTAVLYFKGGNMCYMFNGSQTKKHVYLTEKNERIMEIVREGKQQNIKTDLTKPNSFITRLHNENKNRLYLNCTFKPAGSDMTIQNTYTYDTTLAVNPSWFKLWHYNHDNVLFDQTRSMWTERQIEYDQYIITWKAIKTEWFPVDNNIFNIEK